jgi:hypothetical protein
VSIAGIWTYWQYAETNRLAFEQKFSVNPELHWNNIASDGGLCRGMFSIEAKNDGLQSVDVESADVTAWLFDPRTLPAPTATNPALLQLKAIEQNGVKWYSGDADPIQRDIVDHYSPGMATRSEAHFVFRKAPGMLVVFRIDISGRRARNWLSFGGSRDFHNYGWTWDWVCGLDSQASDPTRSPSGAKSGPR